MMRADAWAALAQWVTAAIAFGAAIFAWRQVREARKTREEQAQPNVVLYTEPNPAAKQIQEIVVKNFGTTPAYNVKVAVTPPLKATPNLISIDKIADVPIPEFPILAPCQEWRTVWDHAISRKRYMRKLHEQRDNGSLTTPEFEEQALITRHMAVVAYVDSRNRPYETHSVLDYELRKGTTWVDVKTVHDLTKNLDDHFKTQNRVLGKIYERLADFSTEHDGIWIYGSHDDDERDHRRRVAEAEAADQQEFMDTLHGRHRENEQAQTPDDETDETGV